MGFLERGGNLRIEVMRKDVQTFVYVAGTVDKASVLMTDAANAYKRVGREYAFYATTDHGINEYVREGVIHTNTIEGAFSLLDRMIIGIYHYASLKYMQTYLN